MINWFYFWRRMHCLNHMRHVGNGWGSRSSEWGLDTGYCIDSRVESWHA